MPNIEVYGSRVCGVQGERCIGDVPIRARIKEIFADWSCVSDMIINIIVDSDPRDLQGVPQPFLRVWDTNVSEGERIAFRIRLEGFDVELPPPLKDFLPKPLYSLGEIEAELRSLTAHRPGDYADASQALRSWEGVKERVCPYFLNAILSLPRDMTNPPSAEELSNLASRPMPLDPSAEPWRDRFIRWRQMLAILGG